MSLTLSSRELALLGDALSVVCAPYAHRSSGEWHAAVRLAVEPLLGEEPAIAARTADAMHAADPHAVAIRELLRPAFLASTDLLARRRAGLTPPESAELIDALPEAAVVCAASGVLLHENPALRRLLAAEPHAFSVRSAISAAARSLAAIASAAAADMRRAALPAGEPAGIEAHGAQLRYELRGARLDQSRAQPRGAATIFLVRSAPPRALTDAELRARFALTVREIEVMRLLAVGRSARDVAATLGLSYFTARHHVEHVLAKLGVRTRAAVAAATTAVDHR